MNVTITDQGYDAPDSVPGGLVRIRAHNQSTVSRAAELALLKDGATLEQFNNAFALGDFDAAAEELERLSSVAGGVARMQPGSTSEVVLDLEPGRYVFVSYNSSEPFTRLLEVTAAPADQPAEPDAQQTISMIEFAFDGAPDTLPAGPTTVEVVNDGRQIHWMEVQRVTEGVTADQVTPVPNYMVAGGMGELEPGYSGWAILALSPGVYLLLCGVTDLAGGSGKQHFQLGMYHVFTVQ